MAKSESEDLTEALLNKMTLSLNPSNSKLMNFSGEKETYDLWRYDVVGLQRLGHAEAQVLHAARRSLRGEAARILLRLGEDVTVKKLLNKFDSVYGDVDAKEVILADFYSAKQNGDEDVARWGCRLEDLLGKAVEKKAVGAAEADEMLRQMFWRGLIPDLKSVAGHVFDKSECFDDLRTEMRRIEKDFNVKQTVRKKPEPAKAAITSATTTEMEQLKAMVMQLSNDMNEMKNQMFGARNPGGAMNFQGNRNRGRGRGRQLASQGRRCYTCGEMGHMARDCHLNGQPPRMRDNHWVSRNVPYHH